METHTFLNTTMDSKTEKMDKMKEAILDILLPRICVGCGKEGKYICGNCELFLSETPNSIDNLFTVWEYEGIIEKAIWKIKYDGMFHIIDELVEKAFGKIELNLPPDACITYVPMYKEKERHRGFNQAELIAKEVGEITGKEVVKLLDKVKDSKFQAGLSSRERMENVKDSFSFNGSLCPQNLLLIDDFYASGATIRECQRVLRENGVENIWGFALAKSDH